MSETKHIDAAFTSPEDEQFPEPRAISWLAVSALALGLASASALTARVTWILPLAGVAVAAAALRSIAKDPDRRLGRSAAMAGLLLSLLFGSWGVSNYLTRQRLIYRQSEALAATWLQMVLEGRVHEAHQLTLPQQQRRPPDTEMAEYYERNEEARTGYEEFWNRPPLPDLLAAGPAASIRFVRDESLERTRDFAALTETVTQRFVIEYEQDRRPQRLAVQMVMDRSRDRRSGEARWRVAAVNSVRDGSR